MFFSKHNLSILLSLLTKAFLFILPWQTVLIIQERYLNGCKWQYGTLQFFLSEAVAWLLFFVFFLWTWNRIKERIKLGEIKFSWSHDRIFTLSVLLFMVYSLLSAVWAPDRSAALQQSLRVIEAFLIFFVIFLGPISKKEIVFWFLAGSIAPAILGIAQFVFQTTWESKWLGLPAHLSWEAGASIVDNGARWLRAYGPFAHPNIFGGYLAITMVFIFYYLRVNFVGGFYKNIFLSLLIIILSSALFFTFSRSAWIGLVILIALSLYYCVKFKKTNWPFMIIPAMILIVGSIIYFPLINTRINQASLSETNSIQERLAGLGEAKEFFLKYPWLGAGSGNYTAASYLLDNQKPGWEYQPAHNAPILFFVEFGICGAALFIFIIYNFVRYRISLKQNAEENKLNRESLLLLLLMPMLLFDHYFLSSYIGTAMMGLFFGFTFKHNVHS